MSSRCVVLAAAVAVSSMVIFVAFSQQKSTEQILRSCLCSEKRKRERRKKKKTKVRFAENVKEPSGNGKEYRKAHRRKKSSAAAMAATRSTKATKVEMRNCRNEVLRANAIAVYNELLKDFFHRIECS